VIVFRDELKRIHANAIRRANKATTKFAKVHGATMPKQEGNKLEIWKNSSNSQNQGSILDT
jgi:hypothetical protein